MSFTVVEYIREDGSNPYREWFDGLDPQAAAKVAAAIVCLEIGNTSRLKWIGTIGECRIDWGPGYRIYLAKDRNALIVLFGGGTKRGQTGDIRRAERLFAEYKRRKAAAAKSQG
jgi:putative addiction module killer protein